MKTMLRFAVPMILGNLLQQCYNIADTLIVGKFLGAEALAAVGSAFSLMTFLTSILLGLAMGSGTVFSIRFGQKNTHALRKVILASFTLLGAITVILNVLIFIGIDWVIWALRTPANLVEMMREYLLVIFAGMVGIFLYNFFASLLRSLGNSVIPLVFLAVSACINIGLDLWFVAGLNLGVAGAAKATVISQYVSGIGIAVYTKIKFPGLLKKDEIGGLFLLYGLYRAIGKPGMPVILTIVSLGTRVALSYTLSAIPAFDVAGIWWSVPIGWLLADVLGVAYYFVNRKKLAI